MEQVEERLKAYSSATNQSLQQVANLAVGTHQNTVALAKSHDDLNDQFAVLVRLFFSRMNTLIDLQNRIFELACDETNQPKDHPVPRVTYEEINALFALFEQFKSYPNYKDHFRVWYTGEDLGSLPPVEEPSTSEETPEGAEVFGGDYDSTSRNGPEEVETERAEGEAADQDPVPELPSPEDRVEDNARLDEAGSMVPGL